MKIGIVDIDGHNFPNLALMKIARYHKMNGDSVSWFQPLFDHPDKIYASKVFTFTNDYDYFPADVDVEIGGTGYKVDKKLPEEIEQLQPDYTLYPDNVMRNGSSGELQAFGFLTRGCIRNCPWCVVPKKEGGIRIVSDIDTILQGRNEAVLMDNNFLAAPKEFVKEQLERISKLKVKIDFNQALDARLVDEENSILLAKVKWQKYIRFSCDTQANLKFMPNAVKLLRNSGYKGDIFVYALAKDVDETIDRIHMLEDMDKRIIPFVMPYRDYTKNGYIDPTLKKLSNWCNKQSVRKSCTFNEFLRSFKRW